MREVVVLIRTDLIADVAQKVMGWTEDQVPYDHFSIRPDIGAIQLHERPNLCRIWNPIESVADMFEIIHLMQANGYKYSLIGDSIGETARFAIEKNLECDTYSGYAPVGEPGEAVCRAALAAKEADNAK